MLREQHLATIGAATAWQAAGNCNWGKACPPHPGGYVWTQADYDALKAGAAAINCKPEDLLLVLYYESGLGPACAYCINGYPSAVGLNQLTETATRGWLTEAERLSLLDKTAAEQIPYVVKYYLRQNGGKPFVTPPDAVTLYQYNIAPGTVPNETIYKAKVFPCPPKQKDWAKDDYYCFNQGLDKNKDGVITRSDLADVLRATASSGDFKKALAQLNGTAPILPPPQPKQPAQQPSASGSYEASFPWWVVLAGAVGGGGYYLYKKRK